MADAGDGTFVPVRNVAGSKSRCPGKARANIRRGIEGVKKWRVKDDPNAPNANIDAPPKPPPPPSHPKQGTKRPVSAPAKDEGRLVLRSGPKAHHEVFHAHRAGEYRHTSSGGTRSSGVDDHSRGRNYNDVNWGNYRSHVHRHEPLSIGTDRKTERGRQRSPHPSSRQIEDRSRSSRGQPSQSSGHREPRVYRDDRGNVHV